MKNSPEISSREQQRLKNSTAWQKRPSEAEPIGLIIDRFLQTRNPQWSRAEPVVRAWESAVPAQLRTQSRLVGFASGILTVEVLSGPFLHQMQMLRKQILEELKACCPRSGLREIRILPGGPLREEEKP